jgi:hypothetical protein
LKGGLDYRGIECQDRHDNKVALDGDVYFATLDIARVADARIAPDFNELAMIGEQHGREARSLRRASKISRGRKRLGTSYMLPGATSIFIMD